GHVHRVVHAATPGEVLDVVVSAVLTGGNGAGSVPTDSPQVRSGQRPSECAILARGEGKGWHPVGIRGDKGSLPPIPLLEQRRRRRSPEETGVSNACVPNARDVTRCRVLAVKVPDCLVRVREVVRQESATVVLREDAGVPPPLSRGVAVLLRRL